MRTTLVTGASDGIGLEASIQIARLGGRLVMVGHRPDKTSAALDQVRTAAPDAEVTSLTCDLADFASVRALAARVRDQVDRLDVLVNNAGAVFKRRTLTPDGIESTFAVNHLGGFLLTELLLDLIVSSAPARVIFTSSGAHFSGTMDFDDLGFAQGYRIMSAYSRSKLANVLYARELANRLAATGVTVNAFHPGAVATSIWDGAPTLAKPVLAVAKRWRMDTPEQGAQTLTYLATSPEVEGRTGGYYQDCRIREPAALARDEELGRRLYDESARLVGLT